MLQIGVAAGQWLGWLHSTHSGPEVPMMQNGAFAFAHPAAAPVPPTVQRAHVPVVVLHTGALAGQSAAPAHPRHLRVVASQIGVAPVQSAATPGLQPTHMFICGIVASGA
jgi:hypothetical protein